MSPTSPHTQLIHTFYTAFINRDAQVMADCYHQDAQFEDPAFGKLNADEVKKMWKMLIDRGGEQLKVSYKDVMANEVSGSATWEAHYVYGRKKRRVHNAIKASFVFKDGKIINHKDDFDLYRWSRQALGLPGYLLGWSGFMRKKIQLKTRQLLVVSG